MNPMRRLPPGLVLLALAACTPPIHHREVQRPIPAGTDAYRCSVRQVQGMGYTLRDQDPPSGFAAARERPQRAGYRYPIYDYLVVDVLGDEGASRVLRVGAVTLAGGGGGVSPHFRAPLRQTEADRDTVLDACTGGPPS